MPTQLDQRMAATMAALTGEDGPLRLGSIERFGRTLPTIAVAPPSLPAYFAHYCAEHAGLTFLVAGSERLTFAQTHAEALKVARALVRPRAAGGFGVAPGDRVGIAMRNSPSWVVLYMGILIAGGVATLLNGWWQSGELAAAIRDVDCRLVFADAARAERLRAAEGLATEVVAVDDTQPLVTALAAVAARDDPAAALPTLGPDDHATILFTSGSTGRSKGALSDHRGVTQATFNFLAQALTMLSIMTADGKAPGGQHGILLNLPLFHVTGMVPMLLQSFAIGRKVVLMPRWDAEEAMRLIEAEGVTYFVGVPLMSIEMATHPRRHRYDLSTVTDYSGGGGPRPVDHVRRIDKAVEGAPLNGYGLTETNAAGAINARTNYLAKPTSTGPASRPLVEIAILDDDGAALPTGEQGEIGVRGVGNILGYWNDEAATAAAFTADGFLRTGDLGHLDEDGYLFIVDRKKDIIIRGGENISCQEVEDALYLHPAVAEAAVFGLPDDRMGEVPGAAVTLRGGETADAAELCGFLDRSLAAFKIPRRLWIEAGALPRLGTEKIDKVALRARYRAIVAAETA